MTLSEKRKNKRILLRPSCKFVNRILNEICNCIITNISIFNIDMVLNVVFKYILLLY